MSAPGRMNGARRKYMLLAGSELLRATYWARAENNVLKGLIKRFATREDNCRSKGVPPFVGVDAALARCLSMKRDLNVYPTSFAAIDCRA